MKRVLKGLLIILLLFIPTVVLAKNSLEDGGLPLGVALFMEAFVSIHMSVFVLKPLSEIFGKENSKQLFWTLFIIRALILISCDILFTTMIALVDFFAVFIGAMIIVPICAWITKTPLDNGSNQVIDSSSFGKAPDSYHADYTNKQTEEKHSIFDKGICPYCGATVAPDQPKCAYCNGKNDYY